MEIAVTPETYTPGVDENGRFVDVCTRTDGCACPCTGKFYKRASFGAHTKTQRHSRWLEELNLDRGNYLRISIEQEATIREQRRLIAQLSKEVDRLRNRAPPVEDLILL